MHPLYNQALLTRWMSLIQPQQTSQHLTSAANRRWIPYTGKYAIHLDLGFPLHDALCCLYTDLHPELWELSSPASWLYCSCSCCSSYWSPSAANTHATTRISLDCAWDRMGFRLTELGNISDTDVYNIILVFLLCHSHTISSDSFILIVNILFPSMS